MKQPALRTVERMDLVSAIDALREVIDTYGRRPAKGGPVSPPSYQGPAIANAMRVVSQYDIRRSVEAMPMEDRKPVTVYRAAAHA